MKLLTQNIILFSALMSIVFSPLGEWLESTMVSHVLLEIPLLIFLGVGIGVQLKVHYPAFLLMINRGGICGILLATFTLGFWMIPRWLDASLTDPLVAQLKYMSLVCLVGIPLAMSWPLTHFITRAVVKIEFLAMLFRLGWLYLISPERLCNSYLLTDQVWLGQGFLLIGAALSVSWLLPVFLGDMNSVRQKVLVE